MLALQFGKAHLDPRVTPNFNWGSKRPNRLLFQTTLQKLKGDEGFKTASKPVPNGALKIFALPIKNGDEFRLVLKPKGEGIEARPQYSAAELKTPEGFKKLKRQVIALLQFFQQHGQSFVSNGDLAQILEKTENK